MKLTKPIILLSCLLMMYAEGRAQESEPSGTPGWDHSLAASFYLIPDGFFVLPVYRVDGETVHLEARFNYEDKNTFSTWFGYNFSGGNTFQYSVIPMAGIVAGNTNALAPGVEFDLSWKGFELYSEWEYLFSLQGRDEDFLYTWTDLTWSPLDWLSFGLSIQRTKAFETNLDIQRGLELGFNYRWFSVTGYVFNLGFDDPYGIITLTASIPE